MTRSMRIAFSPFIRVDADGASAEAIDPELAHLTLDSEGAAELGLPRTRSSSSSGRSVCGRGGNRRRCILPLGRVLLVGSACLALSLLAAAAAVGWFGAQERRRATHEPAASPGGVVGLDASVPAPAGSTSVTVDQLVRDAFPGELHHWFTKWNPMFTGATLHEHFDCAKPNPTVFFNNLREASHPLFHNHSQTFPMAMNYMDSSDWARPGPGHKQTVLGFAEMQWAYYHYNGDLRSTSPYLVISMNPFNYTPRLNFQFVECGLLGWPEFPLLAGGDYPLRLIIKNPTQGQPCTGFETGHAWCNLETSWGMHPEVNNWRPTTMEVNALVQLCTHKYRCDIQKASLEAPEGKEVPQVYVFRVLRDAAGNPLPPAEPPSPGLPADAAPSQPPQPPPAGPAAGTAEASARRPPPPPVPSSPALRSDSAAAEDEAQGCSSVCEFEGWTGTCQHYTQWVADQYPASDPNACVEGYVTALEICPHCWGCALADSQCVRGGDAEAESAKEEEEEEFATLAEGCDTLCHHDGWLATCNTRIQFAANHNFQDQPEPCADALDAVHKQCPACATQCQALVDTTCSLETADQWTALMLRREDEEEKRHTTAAPAFVQAEDAYVK